MTKPKSLLDIVNDVHHLYGELDQYLTEETKADQQLHLSLHALRESLEAFEIVFSIRGQR